MSLAALKEKLSGYGVDTATPGLTGNQTELINGKILTLLHAMHLSLVYKM